jgi:GNAT superfamily N-acetyltransferase
MKASIWEFERSDEEPVVGLSLGARKPVFAAMEEILGAELFVRLRGDWRAGQAQEVCGVLADHARRVWVAEAGGGALRFGCRQAASRQRCGGDLRDRSRSGARGRGVGTALTGVATGWLWRSGLLVAVIEAGGGPGHAPARRVCEEAGYTALPAVRFFGAL